MKLDSTIGLLLCSITINNIGFDPEQSSVRYTLCVSGMSRGVLEQQGSPDHRNWQNYRDQVKNITLHLSKFSCVIFVGKHQKKIYIKSSLPGLCML